MPPNPPRAPLRRIGRTDIGRYLRELAQAPLRLEVSDEVVGPERVAYRLTTTLPEERRVIE
ncbi:MAG: hypothetical protein AB1505_31475, partial [Candidatus Latescibacterota bacterium]